MGVRVPLLAPIINLSFYLKMNKDTDLDSVWEDELTSVGSTPDKHNEVSDSIGPENTILDGDHSKPSGDRNISIVIGTVEYITERRYNEVFIYNNVLDRVKNIPITYVSQKELDALNEFVNNQLKSDSQGTYFKVIIRILDKKAKASVSLEKLISNCVEEQNRKERNRKARELAEKKLEAERKKKLEESRKKAQATLVTREINQMKKLITIWGKELLQPGINCASIVELSDKQLLEVRVFNKLYKKHNAALVERGLI